MEKKKQGAEGINKKISDMLGEKFPEREFIIRANGKIKHFKVSTRKQVCLVVLATALLGWNTGLNIRFAMNDAILEAKNETIAELSFAKEDMFKKLLKQQEKWEVLSYTHSELKSDFQEVSGKNQQIIKELHDVKNKLQSSEAKYLGLIAARDELKEQLRRIKDHKTTKAEIIQGGNNSKLSALSTPDFAVGQQLSELATDLKQVKSERDNLQEEKESLEKKIAKLDNALSEIQDFQLNFMQRFADLAVTNVVEMEKAISMVGLDPNHLLSSRKERFGKGGPFIPVSLNNVGNQEIVTTLASLNRRIDRWDDLNNIVRTLPLLSPLKNYSITSPFGMRNDPINDLTGIHEGVDLQAPLKASVFATAPGKVVFAGWKDRYGRLVEVDHGMSVVTRYAHLQKISVKPGQMVDPGTVVGLLGSSGRSTGPHLHYEVVVSGKPRDPLKFISAGRHVLKEK